MQNAVYNHPEVGVIGPNKARKNEAEIRGKIEAANESYKPAQITKEQAIKFYESGVWKDMTAKQIVDMQLPQKKLCVPFAVFQDSISDVLGRSVYSHEFADRDALYNEVFNGATPPTFEEIMSKIPQDKQLLIFAE